MNNANKKNTEYIDSTEEDIKEMEKRQKEKISNFVVNYTEDNVDNKVVDNEDNENNLRVYNKISEIITESEENVDDEDSDTIGVSKLSIIISSLVISVLLIVSIFILYNLYDAKNTIYDIDAVYYTTQNLVPSIEKAGFFKTDKADEYVIKGNNILPISLVTVKTVERPKVNIGNSMLFYLYKNIGLKVLEIGEDDEVLKEAGIEVGDIIYRVQDKPVYSVEEFKERVSEFKEAGKVYTLYKRQGKGVTSTYLNTNKNLSLIGEYTNVLKRTVCFTENGNCYSFGIPYFNTNYSSVGLRVLNYKDKFVDIDYTNCETLYDEQYTKNVGKILKESNYGIIYDMQGEWNEGNEIEIGFAWEIDYNKEAYIQAIDENSGEVKAIKVRINKERCRVDNILDYEIVVEDDNKLKEYMLGAAVIQNGRLIGTINRINDEDNAIFIAADRLYFEYFEPNAQMTK